jgi:hypothetical protein
VTSEREASRVRSRSTTFTVCSIALIGAVVLLCSGAELFARFQLQHASKIEGRTATEWREVKSLGSNGTGQMLIVGNSLLLMGVDMDALKRGLSPELTCQRFVVEQTTYLDWYFGLRKIYDEGVRPAVIVVSMNARHLISDAIRGEYSAYWLIKTSDVLGAAHAAHLPATATTSLLLGNLSAYYGTRMETRKVLLKRTLPAVQQLQPYLTPAADRTPLDGAAMISLGAKRLREMNDLVSQHGGVFVFVVPAFREEEESLYFTAAAAEAGITPIVPLSSDDVTDADFVDGFHLNPTGASRYTTALIPLLRRASLDRIARR